MTKKKNQKNGLECRGFLCSLLGKIIIVLILILLAPAQSLKAQWTNDPSLNTRLASETTDPVNISVINNPGGGLFLFWEDAKKGAAADIRFQFVDKIGKPVFKNDGRKISSLAGKKMLPISTRFVGNSALVMWKDFTNEAMGNLMVQRVFSNGSLGWSENGLQITEKQNITSYSINSDSAGNVFIVYGEKAADNYKIVLQKVSANGYLMFKMDGVAVHKSSARNSSISVLADERGGAYLLWLENVNNKTQVMAQHIDSVGKPTWGKQPVSVSMSNNSVLSFTSQLTKQNSIYLVWQAKSKSKDILHQLINSKGRPQWGSGGRLVSQQKGDQLNPCTAVSDSALYISWTNEYNHDKDVYAQKFRLDGKPLWKENGIPVISTHGDQFGQKIFYDSKSGIFIAWIDKRVDSLKANIYGQRINKAGRLLWDSLGMPIAKYKNSEKSYLTLLSDYDNSSIIVFKDMRGANSGIYGQKVFSISTILPQLVGLKTKLVRDSVSITWYNTDEATANSFSVQKLMDGGDGSAGKWVTIATVPVNRNYKNAYEVFDKPYSSGVQNYRVVISDREGNSFLSEESQVNYFSSGGNIILGQNSPNPFSDYTEISFYLPEPMRVSFEFYNSKLETVREISNQYFEAGENKIAFNADNLPAGIYFYRLKAGEFVDVKKMVLVR